MDGELLAIFDEFLFKYSSPIRFSMRVTSESSEPLIPGQPDQSQKQNQRPWSRRNGGSISSRKEIIGAHEVSQPN